MRQVPRFQYFKPSDSTFRLLNTLRVGPKSLCLVPQRRFFANLSKNRTFLKRSGIVIRRIRSCQTEILPSATPQNRMIIMKKGAPIKKSVKRKNTRHRKNTYFSSGGVRTGATSLNLPYSLPFLQSVWFPISRELPRTSRRFCFKQCPWIISTDPGKSSVPCHVQRYLQILWLSANPDPFPVT